MVPMKLFVLQQQQQHNQLLSQSLNEPMIKKGVNRQMIRGHVLHGAMKLLVLQEDSSSRQQNSKQAVVSKVGHAQ
jgi:hypothetical protein